MPTSYSPLLGLALPVTGELAGTWGDTVNDYITKYLDSSVAGTQTISGSQTAVTLSVTNGTTLVQVGSGATGSAQYQVINCTGNPASLLTVTVPAQSKTYVVVNATSTNQQVKIVGTGPTTGVTLDAGEKAVIAWNGSDFIKVATSTVDGVSTIAFGTTGLTPSSATSGAVTVAGTLVAANGGTGQSTYTTGDLLYATGSTALSKLGIGTNGQVLTSTGTAPQWSTLSGVAVTTFSAGTTGFTPSSATSGAITLAGTLATTNGGTGLTSFTANGVVYASSSSALTTGSALTFDGTTTTTPRLALGGTTLPAAGTATLFSRSSDNNTYLQTGSGNSFLVLDGSQNTMFQASPTLLGFNISNAEQMRLTSTGLGIGTSSPVAKLSVRGGNGNQAVFDNAGERFTQVNWHNNGTAKGAIWIDNNTSLFEFYGYSGVGITFSTNGTERMRLDSSGNLGIGTSSPSVKLQSNVSRTSGQNVTALVLSDTVTGAQTSGFGTQIQGWSNNGSAQSAIGFEAYGGTNNDTALGFYTQASAGGLTRRMTISSTGDVGIGTSSPAAKLHISGSTTPNLRFEQTNSSVVHQFQAASGNFFLNIDATNAIGGSNFFIQQVGSTKVTFDSSGNLGIGTSSPTARLTVVTSVNNEGVIRVSDNATYYGELSRVNATDEVRLGSYGPSQNLTFYTVSSERMRLDSSGNLGLGVTPSAWETANSVRALQFNGGQISSYSTSYLWVGQNFYRDSTSTEKYVNSGFASKYQQNSGIHSWHTAPSGTAGNAISFTQAMTLTAQGNELFVGTTSGFNSTINRGNISVNGSSDSIVALGSGGTRRGYLYAYPTQMNVGSDGILGFETGGTERFHIASNGAWGLAGANYGTSGQVLTSNGSGSAPTWQNAGAGSSQWTTSGSNIYFDGSAALRSAVTTVSQGKIFEVGFAGTGISSTSGTSLDLTNNAYYNSGWKYGQSGKTARIQLSDDQIYFFNATTGTAGNAITFTQTLAIQQGKTLALEGASLQTGTGITFPATQSASTDANTLDDYEEGTWTPSIGGTATYGSDVGGRYVKVGKLVTIIGKIQISSIGTGSTTTISGLPFTAQNSALEAYGSTGYYSGLAVNVISPTCSVDTGTAVLKFYGPSTASSASGTYVAIFQNAARIYFSCTYETNA